MKVISRRQAFSDLLAAGLLASVPVPGFTSVYLSTAQAIATIFPELGFSAWKLRLDEGQVREIERRSNVKLHERNPECYRANTGEVVFIDRVLGKHDLITYACGIAPDGMVKQVEIIEYREIYGGEIRDKRWREQFIGKNAAAPIKLDTDVRNISGATLSCRHVTDGVRRLLATFEVVWIETAPRTALAGLSRRG